jgi:hypothetical protein
MALDEFAHSSPDALQRAARPEEAVTADTKYGKAEVNYRAAGSSNTRCERCAHFRWASRGTGTCRIVAGRIDPMDVCDKYSRGGGGLMDLVTGEATR